ncbi:MAG: hypothetical protein IJ840_03915, partial [Bacteroidales bacterium]|nr:hypothetical protein [Bacteroidales bacterium]
MSEKAILIILAVVTGVSLVSMVLSLVLGARERRRLVAKYEDEEDALQERITSLASEKASVESLLAAREEYSARLIEEREKA